MKQEIAKMLKQDMSWALDLRGELIKNRLALMETAMESTDQTAIYRHLSELSKLTETLCRELREAMTTFFSDLQLVGVFPELIPFPNGGEVTVTIDGDCLKLELPALLPFSAGGSVYYLHEQVRAALEQAIRERKLPRPIFNERCALVFIHHYANRRGAVRYLRDYDNLEHRCITNALAMLAMWDDSPECIISLDILAPGERDFTEIRIMPLPAFKRFAASENFGGFSA